jgi:hypothetical protein
MADANEFQKAYIEAQKKLAKDIRPMIARSGMYNPEADPEYVFQPFPETVKLPGGREVIVNNQEEKDAVLKVTPLKAKAVDVDVATLVTKQQAEPPRQKRKYTKRASTDLPANLE